MPHKSLLIGSLCILLTTASACSSQQTETATNDSTVAPPVEESTEPNSDSDSRILSVETTPLTDGTHTFNVTIESDETGCDRYANWWEVIDEDNNLLYRRILAHSHVNEQPFTRSGGPVTAEPQQTLIVRSHMHPTGYSTQAAKGSIESGFEPTTLPPNFAPELSETEPLPTGCTF